jgi:flagellar motility protein MotE (MotC chaperone)
MIRILQSSWLTALVGCLLYLGTTFALIRPEKFAAAHLVPSDASAPDDASWKFKNPEFDQWIAQMKDEKESLALREQQLNEWQSRLDAERQEISTVTQTVSQLQADFDRNVIRFRVQETDNVRHQAKLIAAMSPAGAAAMFNEMADDDVVRILFTMKTDDASLILDTMSKLGKPEARRAAVLTGRLHQVLPLSTNAVSTAAH